MFRVAMYGEDNITHMAARLADGPDHLREHLGQAIRRAARPTLRDVKRGIASNRIVGYRTGAKRVFRRASTPKGLRAAIAAAVDVDINVGTLNPRARFVVRTYKLGKRRRLPGLIEAGNRWRHPIMGRRGRWAAQSGQPWFEKNVRRNLPLFSRRVDEAVDRVARAIS